MEEQRVADVRRLIVRVPNWLGDAVMALPALGALRRHFAGAHLTIVARASIAPLFATETDARPDGVVAAARETERDQLREIQSDAILLFTNSFRSAWVARRAGVAERWGYRTSGRGWLLTRGVRRPRGHIHMTQYYLELVRRLGIDAPDTPPRVTVPPALRARGEALLADAGVAAHAPVVGFAPGAAYGRAKRWPPDRVAAVAARLDARGIVPVLVGASDDRGTGREIESSLPAGDSALPNQFSRSAATPRECWRAAARSSRTTPARCTSPRRSACRWRRSSGPRTSASPLRRVRAAPTST